LVMMHSNMISLLSRKYIYSRSSRLDRMLSKRVRITWPVFNYPAIRISRLAASFVIVSMLLAATESGYALEPTPSQPANDSPVVVNKIDVPASARIIVKYVEAEAGRVEDQQAALNAVKILSEIAGTELRHIRLMSGNAQVVEVIGIADLESTRTQEKIESIVQRIEADPAVEYAEPDALMQIQ